MAFLKKQSVVYNMQIVSDMKGPIFEFDIYFEILYGLSRVNIYCNLFHMLKQNIYSLFSSSARTNTRN